jgi:8-oxo-dGTP pyrophosphatase MutT (NUDIX family)
VSFERIGGRTVWEGRIATVRVDRFRYEDGEEAEREIVAHPGSVAVVAFDGRHLFLVRQPREPVNEPALLELPAGKLDEAGETVLECARRELAEEIGKAAEHWEHLTTYKTSAGFTDEVCHIYLATGLQDKPGYAIADERITIEARRLADLGALIGEVTDAKTLIGLLLLRQTLDR